MGLARPPSLVPLTGIVEAGSCTALARNGSEDGFNTETQRRGEETERVEEERDKKEEDVLNAKAAKHAKEDRRAAASAFVFMSPFDHVRCGNFAARRCNLSFASAALRPEGAPGCRHGWSAARAHAGAAQPVDGVPLSFFCPDGAEDVGDSSPARRAAAAARAVLRPAGAERKRPPSSTGCAMLRIAPPVATPRGPDGAVRHAHALLRCFFAVPRRGAAFEARPSTPASLAAHAFAHVPCIFLIVAVVLLPSTRSISATRPP